MVCKLWNQLLKEVYFYQVLTIDDNNLNYCRKYSHLVQHVVYYEEYLKDIKEFRNLNGLVIMHEKMIEGKQEFISLVGHFKYLKMLTFYNFKFSLFNKGDKELTDVFNKLKYITVHGNNDKESVNNIETMLSQMDHFNLKELNMIRVKNEVNSNIIEMISKKFINLNKLNIYNNERVNNDLFLTNITNGRFLQLKAFSLSFNWNNNFNQFKLSKHNFNNLNGLAIIIFNNYDYFPQHLFKSDEIWYNLSELSIDLLTQVNYQQFPNLVKLTLQVVDFTHYQNQEIEPNLLNIFTHLKRLKHFKCVHYFSLKQFTYLSTRFNINHIEIGLADSPFNLDFLNFLNMQLNLTQLIIRTNMSNIYNNEMIGNTFNLELTDFKLNNLLKLECPRMPNFSAFISLYAPNLLS
ncbi:hypothetical protein K502DRAFT_147030 [Neoconidiobolus thromboides FSU 785]|nr:hypothetical protein K502DRAFT_147030 [Neoconidiobolus thromboides FSU 785]